MSARWLAVAALLFLGTSCERDCETPYTSLPEARILTDAERLSLDPALGKVEILASDVSVLLLFADGSVASYAVFPRPE